jgi:hypothetical protein
MSLIVEDGSGKPNSNSFIETAYADTYHTARLSAGWPAGTTGAVQALKEAAAIVATDFMCVSFHARWQGSRVTPTQKLDWPRFGAFLPRGQSYPWVEQSNYGMWPTAYAEGLADIVPQNVIPSQVKDCQCELMLRAILLGNGTNTIGRLLKDIAAGTGTVKSRKVGPIEVVYATPGTFQTVYAMAEAIILPLLLASGGSIGSGRIVRG